MRNGLNIIQLTVFDFDQHECCMHVIVLSFGTKKEICIECHSLYRVIKLSTIDNFKHTIMENIESKGEMFITINFSFPDDEPR